MEKKKDGADAPHSPSPELQPPSSVSWNIKATEERERPTSFYAIVLGLMILLLAIAVWQKNFLFGVFVIIAAGTVLFLSQQRPESYSFELASDRFVVGDKEAEYEYERLSHFDVHEYAPDDLELFLVFKERFRPMMRIRIWRGDREKIETFLKTKLPQKKTEPSLLDLLSKIIGI